MNDAIVEAAAKILRQSAGLDEEYTEGMRIDTEISALVKKWSAWKKAPMTEKSDIKPARKELINLISSKIK